MDSYLESNRATWDAWATLHTRCPSAYRLDDFKAGKAGWEPNIPDDIGSVEGKALIHLQCHFGMDSLMWARRGARVTGVDFSEVAIREACALSQEVGVHAEFVCADLYAIPEVLNGSFDIALTYYGTIVWLPDLSRWAATISRLLKSGGFFYMADCHPFVNTLGADPQTGALAPAQPYFESGAPQRFESEGTYAAREEPPVKRVAYEWPHTLSEIVNALIAAGLRIEALREFPYNSWNLFGHNRTPVLEFRDGWWHPIRKEHALPLMFSLRASKP